MRSRWAFGLVLLGCVLFTGLAYKRTIPVIAIHQQAQRKVLINWQQYRRVDAPTVFMRQYSEQRWTATYQQGLYKPPTEP